MKIKRQQNILLIGTKNEYQLLKTWTKNNSKDLFHLNGWYHNKDTQIDATQLTKKYETMTGDEFVDHFVINPSDLGSEILDASIDWAESKGARIHIIQSDISFLNKKFDEKNKFGPFPAVALYREPLSHRNNQLIKILFDYILSTIILMGIFWWFYPLVGLFIKLSGNGPVIIRQERIGINGFRFKCMKFRTMTSNKIAESGAGPLTVGDDSRITWIGKILRKTNLDELPQFINVLYGEMSVIGPRPHMLSEDKEIENKIKRYRIRRFLKPGITGLAAIQGFRGGTIDIDKMQKRIDYDIKYLEEWTLWLDIKIAFITFWKMITFDTGGS